MYSCIRTTTFLLILERNVQQQLFSPSKEGKNERERPSYEALAHANSGQRCHPSPKRKRAVLSKKKKERKKERKRAAPQQPPNPERARFPAGVPASGIESNGTRRPAAPHPSVARAAAPPHRQRGPRGGRGSPPRRPPRHASGDVPGKRPYNLRGRRAPRAGDAAPTHARVTRLHQTRTPATDACEEAAAPLGPSLRPPATVTSGAAPGL